MAAGKQCFLRCLPTVYLAALILSYPPLPTKRNPAGCAPGTVISIETDKNMHSSGFYF
jgi:hypothetical protein